MYFHLKMVVRKKHVADNLNKIVNNYWNRFVLDGNTTPWSNTRNRMQTHKFKIINASHAPVMLISDVYISTWRWINSMDKIVKNYWNRAALDGNPWIWSNTRNRMQTPKINISIITMTARGLKNSSVLLDSTASWRMCITYTSKDVMKMLGCSFYIRCALSIEK
jgi:hypothetical protein